MTWTFLPPWSIRVLVVGALALWALLIFRALGERKTVPLRRQVLSLVMRVLVIALLLAVALNPTIVRPREVPGRPALIVLVDTSYSMSTRDADGKGRLESALAVLADGRIRARLEQDFTLDVRRFDRDASAASLAALKADAAQGRATDLAAALYSAVADLGDRKDQAGVLVVSDGRATTEGTLDAGRLALARSVPLWTWCLGGEIRRRDLWVEVPSSEVLAFSEAEVELTATLHSAGYENRVFAVKLMNGATVAQRAEATPSAQNGEAEVRFKVTAPKQGETRWVIRAAEEPDEAEKDNNERSIYVRAVGDKVRVLVVEGQPHWDTKFLVQCLKRNPRVDVTAIYRLAKERQFGVLSTEDAMRRRSEDLFPRKAEDFDRYDVIILGRSCETFFDDKTEELLTDFVSRRGGGLVFSRGKPYGGRFQPLAKLEPVVWGGGVVQGVRIDAKEPLAPEGPVFELAKPADLEALVGRLPQFDQILHTVGVKPLAVVLADGRSETGMADASLAPNGSERSVVMAYHLYGQGRVATLNASGLWRWSFREKTRPEDEFVYDRFWSGVLRWLLSGSDFLAGHDVALRADRRLCTDEQPMSFLIRTRALDQDAYRPRLSVRGPGTAVEIEPRRQAGGNYVAEAGPFPPGTYEVKLTNNIGRPPELTQTVEVVSASVENRVLSADPALMGRLAQTSEGRVLSAGDVGDLGRIVREWRTRKQLAEERDSMWDRWWVLGAVVAMLGAEWFARRREGLL